MKPLGRTQKRMLIYVELYRRRTGEGPTWAEVRRANALDWRETKSRLDSLRRAGYLTFSDEPRSLRTTPRGLAAALDARRAA
jgi:hypothetical protein